MLFSLCRLSISNQHQAQYGNHHYGLHSCIGQAVIKLVTGRQRFQIFGRCVSFTRRPWFAPVGCFLLVLDFARRRPHHEDHPPPGHRAARAPLHHEGGTYRRTYVRITGRSSRQERCGKWLTDLGVRTLFIEPGSPWENGYIESFHSRLTDELLNGEIFTILLEARVLIEVWERNYNRVRPHSALGYSPPRRRRRSCLTTDIFDGETNSGSGTMTGGRL